MLDCLGETREYASNKLEDNLVNTLHKIVISVKIL